MKEWVDALIINPDRDCFCYVTNVEIGNECWLAAYDRKKNVFRSYNKFLPYQSVPLDVTHYIILPEPPSIE